MFKRGKTQPDTTADTGQERLPGRPIIASAAMLGRGQMRKVNSKLDAAEEAWDLWSKVPEIRRATTWRSSAVSRARLYVARRRDTDTTGTPEPAEERMQQPLRELAAEEEDQAQMLARMSLHLDVVGETWLAGFDLPGTGERRWMVASRDEFDVRSGRPRIRLPETDEWVSLTPEQSVLIRIWRPHPRRANWADSPVYALRYVARELVGLSDRVSADNDSRLAGAGILKVPNELTLPRPESSEGTPNPLDNDEFTAALMEAMVTPLKDRDSANAVVPITVRGPSEHLSEMQHLSLATDLDGQVLPLREAALQRLAHGLDVEPEVVQGNQDDNHWSAFQSEEQGIKLHIKPLLDLLASALTKHYLRPALRAAGLGDADDYIVVPDIADLVVRPNRGPDAVTLFDRRILSAASTRKENGFSIDDSPDPEEARKWLAVDLVKAVPDLAPALLPLVGLGLDDEQLAAIPTNPGGGDDSGGSDPAAADPPNSDNGGRVDPPDPEATASLDTAAATDPWLVTALEVAAVRALDKAGKWLIGRNRANRQHRDIPASQAHTRIKVEQEQLDDALSGAYTELAAAVPDRPCLHDLVDLYVRGLLIQQQPHDRDMLTRMVAASQCAAREEAPSGV